MSFASEEQRRWFFANKGGGGGGGAAGGVPQFSKRELPSSGLSAADSARLQQRAQHDAKESAVAQKQVDEAYQNYYKKESEDFDRQANYWRGEG